MTLTTSACERPPRKSQRSREEPSAGPADYSSTERPRPDQLLPCWCLPPWRASHLRSAPSSQSRTRQQLAALTSRRARRRRGHTLESEDSEKRSRSPGGKSLKQEG
ncbi:uncharacterized protein LOC112205616 isoform X4 [Pan troglodytes]|uniref:uncharacterized protein LOC112205616 isoform X4 n=1 Tax=Pan troglodytes TaxID=9598 RepID=UPI0030137F54